VNDVTELHRLDGDLGDVEIRLHDLRREVADYRHRAGALRGKGTQLVALDLHRMLTALGAANVALDRARRHTRLGEMT